MQFFNNSYALCSPKLATFKTSSQTFFKILFFSLHHNEYHSNMIDSDLGHMQQLFLLLLLLLFDVNKKEAWENEKIYKDIRENALGNGKYEKDI